MIMGCGLFLYMHEIIIIRPLFLNHTPIQIATYKRPTILFFWKNNRWNKETKEIVWSEDISVHTKQLLDSFFELLYEEQIIGKKISIESVCIPAESETAYISCNRYPMIKDNTTYNKWMIIESLLKTVAENVPSIRSIQLLVNHQILNDPHLDFSRPWPITGFCKDCNNCATR